MTLDLELFEAGVVHAVLKTKLMFGSITDSEAKVAAQSVVDKIEEEEPTFKTRYDEAWKGKGLN